MDPASVGDLVKVGGGPELDGIVFDIPSSTKAVVAVVDPVRGPSFRTVNQMTLTERTEAGQHDRALQLLIRRTPTPTRGGRGSATDGGGGRSGFKRGAMHRTTGR